LSSKEIAFLRKLTLFSGLKDKDLIEINNLLESETYNEGCMIFNQGEKGHRVYFVKKGRIKIIRTSEDGNEQILEILQSGDVFAEVILFGINSYPATAITLSNVTVQYLSRERFKTYFNRNPQIGWGMLEVMAYKLFRSQRKIENLGLRNTKGSVASLIIDMISDFDTDIGLKLYINRQDMASLIGTTRETVSRTLSDFKKEGLIKIKDNNLYIYNIDGIRKYIK